MRSEPRALRGPTLAIVRLAAGVSVFLAVFGCSSPESSEPEDEPADTLSPEAAQCISGHPASEPFDVGDVTVASPAPMSGAVAPTRPTVDSFTAECRAEGGTGCDESFISKEAARCIAESLAFEPGLEEWSIALTYHHSYHRVVWGVENLLEDRGTDGYSGKSLTLDAALGTLLGRTGWSATP